MKNKSDLKRKVLCSLLAASTMGIFYSSDALAASVNGNPVDTNGDGIITETELVGAGSHHFIIGQGDKITVATDGNVNQLLDEIKRIKNDPSLTDMKAKLQAVRVALAEHANVGVVGGEAQLDDGLTGLLGDETIKSVLDGMLPGVSDKIINIDTTGEENDVVRTGDTYLQIGTGEGNSPVVIGAVGGDLSINTGLNVELFGSNTYQAQSTTITRNGSVNNVIESGNVIGGVGGSAAVAVGKIDLDFKYFNIIPVISGELNGKTTTTINGDVNTWVNNGANVGGFANGGAAMAIGGEAKSIVNGDTNLIIDSVVDMDGAVDGVVAGASGGGLAVTTIGGTANSIVEGDSNISINNGLAGGIIGGGIAAAVDAAGLLDVGNDDGTSTITDQQLEDLLGMSSGIPAGTITINEAIQGGEATAKVNGNVNINLTGTTTGVGVVGGGMAVASHSYTNRDNTDGDTENNGTPGGSSTATVETGKVTINVELDSTKLNKKDFFDAIKGMKSSVEYLIGEDETDAINAAKEALKNASNQGAAAGIFGGGIALAEDDANSKATANTAGADINLISGYAAGVFGGGASVAMNNSTAESNMTDTVNINIFNTMNDENNQAVGIFGNGLAYFSGSSEAGTANLQGSATVTAINTNINVEGMVDGIVGGGLAIDDSQSDTTNAIVKTEGKSTINIYDGAEINTINFDGFNGFVTDEADKVDMSEYVAGVKDAAENVAIAAGGVAVGGGAESTVENAEVNVFGTVNGDIIGGGVAAYGYDEEDDNPETDANEAGIGAHVDKSTLNLYAGAEINGNVYAGGSVSVNDASNKGYTEAQATVGEATINLAGATVTGVLSGKGVSGTDNDKALKSFMNVSGENTLGLVDDNGTKVSKISAFNETNFSAGSVTTLDGGLEAGNTVAVINGKLSDTENGVITVADGAKLNISELTAGKGNTYLVASNYAEKSTFWSNDALLYDRTENYADAINGSDGYKVSYKDLADLTEAEQDKAVKDFVDSLGEGGDNFEGTANGIIRNGENTNAGAKDFFSDYTKGEGTSRDLAAMAMIGEAAGVTSNTIDVAGDMADNSVLRLSFTQDNITGEPKVNEDGAIWAKYIHNKHDLDGMASSFGDINSSSDFDGATVGVDFAKKGKVQSGIAFSYGDGDSHGMGINNDFDMWGLTLYGNVKNDDTNVIADIGFSESDNELTGTAMGKDIKADRDVSVFTVGVRAEKLYTNGSTQIVPYTGLRYYNVDPDSYTAYYDGQKFGEYDADRQNIWTLPVGVSLRNETVTESGWRLTPKVDVAYIWAFGDTDNSFDLNTGSGVDTLDYTVMDSGSWLGSVGFEAGKDDWAFGVGYSYQKGSHEEANKWFVNVEYSF